MSFWPFAPASFWATFDSFFEKYQNNMLDVYWSRRLKICLRLRIPHYGICVKLAEAGFYCLGLNSPPRFFLFCSFGLHLGDDIVVAVVVVWQGDQSVFPTWPSNVIRRLKRGLAANLNDWDILRLNWKKEESIVILALWNVDYFRCWLR